MHGMALADLVVAKISVDTQLLMRSWEKVVLCKVTEGTQTGPSPFLKTHGFFVPKGDSSGFRALKNRFLTWTISWPSPQKDSLLKVFDSGWAFCLLGFFCQSAWTPAAFWLGERAEALRAQTHRRHGPWEQAVGCKMDPLVGTPLGCFKGNQNGNHAFWGLPILRQALLVDISRELKQNPCQTGNPCYVEKGIELIPIFPIPICLTRSLECNAGTKRRHYHSAEGLRTALHLSSFLQNQALQPGGFSV